MTQKGPEGANGAKTRKYLKGGLIQNASESAWMGPQGQRATKSYLGALSSTKGALRFKPR